MIAPPDIKAALKKTFAIERLMQAARALLDENVATAQASFGDPQSWRRVDPHNARLCTALRRALAELEKLRP